MTFRIVEPKNVKFSENVTTIHFQWMSFFRRVAERLSGLPTYTVSTVPSASDNPRAMIYVSDETGGAVPAFSDGTNWRRVTDRAVIS